MVLSVSRNKKKAIRRKQNKEMNNEKKHKIEIHLFSKNDKMYVNPK